MSLPAFIRGAGMKFIEIKLQTLQDKDIMLLFENNVRGGMRSVMGKRCVKSDDNKKILHIDANNLYGLSMLQSLAYDESKFDENVILKIILKAEVDSDVGYILEVELNYHDAIKKQIIFHFVPRLKLAFRINLVII